MSTRIGGSIVTRGLQIFWDKYNPRSYYEACRPNLEYRHSDGTLATDTMGGNPPRPYNQSNHSSGAAMQNIYDEFYLIFFCFWNSCYYV